MKPKPIKPRRIWANSDLSTVSDSKGSNYITRPVLVIDLSPESVEELVRAVRHKYYNEGQTMRRSLELIGIRPVKGGRK